MRNLAEELTILAALAVAIGKAAAACPEQATLNGCLHHMQDYPFSGLTPDYYLSSKASNLHDATCTAFRRYQSCVSPYASKQVCDLALLKVILSVYGSICETTFFESLPKASQCLSKARKAPFAQTCGHKFAVNAAVFPERSKWSCHRLAPTHSFLRCLIPHITAKCRGLKRWYANIAAALNETLGTCSGPVVSSRLDSKPMIATHPDLLQTGNQVPTIAPTLAQDFCLEGMLEQYHQCSNYISTMVTDLDLADARDPFPVLDSGNLSRLCTAFSEYTLCTGPLSACRSSGDLLRRAQQLYVGFVCATNASMLMSSHPKCSNAVQYANKLNICKSSFKLHYAAAMKKVKANNAMAICDILRIMEAFKSCIQQALYGPCAKVGSTLANRIHMYAKSLKVKGICEEPDISNTTTEGSTSPHAATAFGLSAFLAQPPKAQHSDTAGQTVRNNGLIRYYCAAQSCAQCELYNTCRADLASYETLQECNQLCLGDGTHSPIVPPIPTHASTNVCWKCPPNTNVCIREQGLACDHTFDTSAITYPDEALCNHECSLSGTGATPTSGLSPTHEIIAPTVAPAVPCWLCDPASRNCIPSTGDTCSPHAGSTSQVYAQQANCLSQCGLDTGPFPTTADIPEPTSHFPVVEESPPSLTCWLCDSVTNRCRSAPDSDCTTASASGIASFRDQTTCSENCHHVVSNVDPVLVAPVPSSLVPLAVTDNPQVTCYVCEGAACKYRSGAECTHATVEVYPVQDVCEAHCSEEPVTGSTTEIVQPDDTATPDSVEERCWVCHAAEKICKEASDVVCRPPPGSSIVVYRDSTHCNDECNAGDAPVLATTEAAIVGSAVQCYFCDTRSGACTSGSGPLCTPPPGSHIQSFSEEHQCVTECSAFLPAAETTTKGGPTEDPNYLKTCAFCDEKTATCIAASDEACNPPLHQQQPWSSMITCTKHCGKEDECREGHFKCPTTGQCVHPSFLCDGNNNCGDDTAEDELLPQCANVTNRCTPNAVYHACGRACAYTCEEPGPFPCRSPCYPHCVCLPGFVLDNGYCIRPSECKTEDSDHTTTDSTEEDGVTAAGEDAVHYYCSGKECMECTEHGCPTDMPTYNTPDDCNKNCPLKPDCYHCDGSNCAPAFGLACYPPADRVTSVFQQQATCVKYCPIQFTCSREKHEVYDDCGSACAPTCENRGNGKCNNTCIPACYCIEGYFKNTDTGKCVRVADCPASDKKWYCEDFDTIFCLAGLAKLPEIVPDLSIISIMKLMLPKNEETLGKVCGLYENYHSCAGNVAEEKSCVVNGPLDQLANTSGDLMCDKKMHELISKNEDCINKLEASPEFKKCSDQFGKVIDIKEIEELLNAGKEKTCQIIKGLQTFTPCQRKVVEDICEPSAIEAQDYMEHKVKTMVETSKCGMNQSIEIVKEHEPVAESSTPEQADVMKRPENLLATTGCSEEQQEKIEECFMPFYNLRNESLQVFSKGIAKLVSSVEDVIFKNCDRYSDKFRPCFQQVLSDKGTCKVYSCSVDSVITACEEKSKMKTHWKCLFSLITDEEVLGCLEGIGISFGSNQGTDWSVVIPKIMDCVDKPVRSKCGDRTMDFLNTLVVPLGGTVDNSKCLVDEKMLARYSEAGNTTVARKPTAEPGATEPIPVPEATEGVPPEPELTPSRTTKPPVTEVATEPITEGTTPKPTEKTTPIKKIEPATFAQVEITTQGSSRTAFSKLNLLMSLTAIFYYFVTLLS